MWRSCLSIRLSSRHWSVDSQWSNGLSIRKRVGNMTGGEEAPPERKKQILTWKKRATEMWAELKALRAVGQVPGVPWQSPAAMKLSTEEETSPCQKVSLQGFLPLRRMQNLADVWGERHLEQKVCSDLSGLSITIMTLPATISFK